MVPVKSLINWNYPYTDQLGAGIVMAPRSLSASVLAAIGRRMLDKWDVIGSRQCKIGKVRNFVTAGDWAMASAVSGKRELWLVFVKFEYFFLCFIIQFLSAIATKIKLKMVMRDPDWIEL